MPTDPVFALLLLTIAAAGLLAVQSHALLHVLRVPAPALFLLASAGAVAVLPGFGVPSQRVISQVVTAALVVVLFDGGLKIGTHRLRSVLGPVLSLGVLGTFVTVLGAAVLAHEVIGISWYLSALLATAIAPTDPAVVFSVLGQREVTGLSGTVLEGESGANDPVGIALMAALISAGSLSGGALGHVATTFTLQLVIGTLVAVVGARLLLWLMRYAPLPAEGLHPVRTLLAAFALFGVATVAHGSGFLAVFLAGILLGDEHAPYKREIERFHAALASLAELVAFALLGFTVQLKLLLDPAVWGPGVVLGLAVAFLVRPLAALPLLLPTSLGKGERAFVLFAGLKGAVPLLLGTLLLPFPGGARLYAIVVVVVLVSVIGQGTLVPLVARWLGVALRPVEATPYELGVRLRERPAGVVRLEVEAGSAAANSAVSELPGLLEGTWVSSIVRKGALVPVRGTTELLPGDAVSVLLDPEQAPSEVSSLFAPKASPAL